MLSAHLSEKFLERGRKEREEGRAHPKTSEQPSGGRGGRTTAPPPPGIPREPALTGRPALSQRLSGKGLPARMMQGRDTGCLSSTRTVEALLAICGGAVGTGDGMRHTDSHGWSPPLLPREPVEASEQGLLQGPRAHFLGHAASWDPDAPLGERGTDTSVPERGRPWGGVSLGGPNLPTKPSSPRSTSEPCPVTTSWASARTFPNTF